MKEGDGSRIEPDEKTDALAHAVIGACLVVELKAVQALAPIHTAQVLSYLKATSLTLGLLVNFNVALLKDGIRRIVLTPPDGK